MAPAAAPDGDALLFATVGSAPPPARRPEGDAGAGAAARAAAAEATTTAAAEGPPAQPAVLKKSALLAAAAEDFPVLPAGYSRKDKSLGLLCENFLQMFGTAATANGTEIELDDASRRLGVERRRIYDIMNVLESVWIVKRLGKNCYRWLGLTQLPDNLRALKVELLGEAAAKAPLEFKDTVAVACEEDFADLLTTFKHELTQFRRKAVAADASAAGADAAESDVKGRPHDQCEDGKDGADDGKQKKSLFWMTRVFLRLFIQSRGKVLLLEDAAKLLLGPNATSGELKTKVRRLYDAANILSSLRLIEKTTLLDSRKPAFKWLGIEDDMLACKDQPLWKFLWGRDSSAAITSAINLTGGAKRGAGDGEAGGDASGDAAALGAKRQKSGTTGSKLLDSATDKALKVSAEDVLAYAPVVRYTNASVMETFTRFMDTFQAAFREGFDAPTKGGPARAAGRAALTDARAREVEARGGAEVVTVSIVSSMPEPLASFAVRLPKDSTVGALKRRIVEQEGWEQSAPNGSGEASVTLSVVVDDDGVPLVTVLDDTTATLESVGVGEGSTLSLVIVAPTGDAATAGAP
eukprot:PRCOL_00005746-RA